MSSFRSRSAAALLLAGTAFVAAATAQNARYPGIGRAATAAEVAAWDIDVRPDFLGLPPGRGTVAQGMVIWEAQCASCHGVFGESNEVFSPLIGGTTAADQRNGRVARLLDPGFPQRTTLMKLSNLSTLWDYIHRAMPWNAPKTLKADEVYAVTAYILNLGGIVPDGFELSNTNIAEVQQRLPNRNGKTTAHAMWPGSALEPAGTPPRRPDVQGSACVKGCASETKVASLLPDHARNAHGNLAEQQRAVGAQLGADTTRPAPTSLPQRAGRAAVATAANAASTATVPHPARALAQKHLCLACHGVDTKAVGPGLREIARKHAGRADAADYLAQKIAEGGVGQWGQIPMPAQAQLPAADLKALAAWLAAGAP
jgi:S-disulfanyl-L-cysteine oxidoreductase SoxD